MPYLLKLVREKIHICKVNSTMILSLIILAAQQVSDDDLQSSFPLTIKSTLKDHYMEVIRQGLENEWKHCRFCRGADSYSTFFLFTGKGSGGKSIYDKTRDPSVSGCYRCKRSAKVEDEAMMQQLELIYPSTGDK